MKRFDGVLITQDKVIFYTVVAELPVQRSLPVEQPEIRKNKWPRWNHGSFLTTEAALREKFDKDNGIA